MSNKLFTFHKFVLELSRLVDMGRNVPVDSVSTYIDNENLFEWLESETGFEIDFILRGDTISPTEEQKQSIYKELQLMNSAYSYTDLNIANNGLCLLISYAGIILYDLTKQ